MIVKWGLKIVTFVSAGGTKRCTAPLQVALNGSGLEFKVVVERRIVNKLSTNNGFLQVIVYEAQRSGWEDGATFS